MYRARVQAISGTKIFADGKWLKCIGNKTFHVGELIWTDGRCVYGNHVIPQQPLVITAQEQEGIPLIFRETQKKYEDYFTFLKRPKQISPPETLSTAGKIKFMINDDKRNVMVVKDEYRNDYDDSERYETIIAANLYRGDLYTLVYSFVEEDSRPIPIRISGGERGTDCIKIEKNGKAILTITTFNNIVDKTFAACPDVPNFYTPSYGNYFFYYCLCYPVWSFIESDTNWAFVILCEITKAVDISYDYPETISILPDTPIKETHNLVQYHYFSSNDSYGLALEFYWNHGLNTDTLSNFIIEKRTATPGTSIAFPLQDNYYFKFDGVHEITEEDHMKAKQLMQRTIFSPSGGEIFTGIFDLWAYMTFCRFNHKNLLGVRHQAFKSFYTNSVGHIPILGDGLYLLKEDSAEKIINGTCLNQRLRPMKKYKNWQTRIQEIIFS